MLQVIDKRFDSYLKFDSQNRELILTALSNPLSKGDFIEKDEDFEFSKQLLIAECHNIKEPVQTNQVVDDTQNTQCQGFLVTFSSRRMARANSVDDDIQIEVKNYLSESQTDYKILHKYPLIKAIFFKYNTTLSSSAAVERVFSQSLMIFTPRRNRISSDHFEQVLLLKHNRKLIDKI